jgi:Na+/H+ antiporter NhaA
MTDLSDMIWIEMRKALRSRMPWLTAAGSLVMPLGIAFLIFVATNPRSPGGWAWSAPKPT